MPSNKAAKGVAEQLEKVGFLKELGADRLVLPNLRIPGEVARESGVISPAIPI